MTTTTLLDAVRADMRARLALIRSLHDVDDALAIVGDALDGLRQAVSARQEQLPADQHGALLAADLVTLDTVTRDLADTVLGHRRAVEAALFGGPRTTA